MEGNVPGSLTPSRAVGRSLGMPAWLRAVADDSRRRAWIGAAVVLASSLGLLAIVQFSSPNLLGNDGYYHIKLAYLMRTDGIKPDFVWLPLTILNPTEFVDHHFLYHLLLIPFTFGDLVVGAKWASVLGAASVPLAIWWLLRQQAVRYPGLWAIGALAVSEAFVYRMSMPRAQSLSLAILVLGLGWLLGGQHRRLLALGFVYVWLYNAFPLLLLACVCYIAGGWLAGERPRLTPLAMAAAGIGLGLVLNPYFPDNLLFVARHLLPKLTDPTQISVGSEWYPYSTAQLLKNSGLALAGFASGAVALGLSGRRMRTETATALLLGLATGVMLFQARRFVEYFPAFGLIFAAFAWSPVLSAGGFGERAGGSVPAFGPAGRKASWGRRALVAAGLALLLWLNLRASIASAQSSPTALRYQEASAWLEQHTPGGARVFQTDWDDFPRLFFYNSHNTYLVGLDPTYLQLRDPALYDRWVELTQGRAEDLSAEIRDLFGTEYAISDLEHTRFLRAAARDPEMEEVYRDEYAVVFRIHP